LSLSKHTTYPQKQQQTDAIALSSAAHALCLAFTLFNYFPSFPIPIVFSKYSIFRPYETNYNDCLDDRTVFIGSTTPRGVEDSGLGAKIFVTKLTRDLFTVANLLV